MNDFIKNHKVLTILLTALLVIMLILIFAGRSIGNFAIEQMNQIRSKDKAVCTVNVENATQIVYKGTTYQILSETVDNSEFGGWSGVFRKIVVLDDNYHILKQVKSEVDSVSQVKEIAKHLPQDAKYVVTYFNAFTIKNVNENQAIAVGLASGTYKAVPAGIESAKKKSISFEKEETTNVLTQLK